MKSARQPAPASRTDSLGALLGDLGRHRRLEADEELSLSRTLHVRQRQEWAIILEHHPAAQPLLGGLPDLFPELSRSIAWYRGRLGRRGLRWELLAGKLEKADLDRSVLGGLEDWFARPGGQVLLRRSGSKHVSGQRRVRVGPFEERSDHARRVRLLSTRGKQSHRIIDTLFRANLRLVLHLARKYRGKGLGFGDLIQEGCIGLLKAIQRFDPEAGNRFATYASWWIRSTVQRALVVKGRTVRLPVQMNGLLVKVNRLRHRYSAQRGSYPRLEDLQEHLPQHGEALEKVMGAEVLPPLSLDLPLGEGSSETFADVICEAEALDVVRDVVQGRRAQLVRDVLATLPSREEMILRRRFGIGSAPGESLASIARDLGVSRERVRQLQEQALQRIRKCLEHRGAAVADLASPL